MVYEQHEDELAFWRTIEATPSDQAPWLIYADWLDENDRDHDAATVRTSAVKLAELIQAGFNAAYVMSLVTEKEPIDQWPSGPLPASSFFAFEATDSSPNGQSAKSAPTSSILLSGLFGVICLLQAFGSLKRQSNSMRDHPYCDQGTPEARTILESLKKKATGSMNRRHSITTTGGDTDVRDFRLGSATDDAPWSSRPGPVKSWQRPAGGGDTWSFPSIPTSKPH